MPATLKIKVILSHSAHDSTSIQSIKTLNTQFSDSSYTVSWLSHLTTFVTTHFTTYPHSSLHQGDSCGSPSLWRKKASLNTTSSNTLRLTVNSCFHSCVLPPSRRTLSSSLSRSFPPLEVLFLFLLITSLPDAQEQWRSYRHPWFPSFRSPPSGLDFQYPCLMQLRCSVSTSNRGLPHNSWGEPLSPPGCSLFPTQLSLLSPMLTQSPCDPLASSPFKYLTPSAQTREKPKLPDINSSHFPLWTSRGLHTSNYLLSPREVKVLGTQLCLALCGPLDYSPPASSIHGIFQARILEWVAISFSRASSQARDRTQVSCITGRFFTIWSMSSWNPAHIREEWLSFSSPKLSLHLALASFPWPNPGDKLLESSFSLTPLKISFSLLMGWRSQTKSGPASLHPLE